MNKCTTCKGTGRIQLFVSAVKCEDCGGTGEAGEESRLSLEAQLAVIQPVKGSISGVGVSANMRMIGGIVVPVFTDFAEAMDWARSKWSNGEIRYYSGDGRSVVIGNHSLGQLEQIFPS